MEIVGKVQLRSNAIRHAVMLRQHALKRDKRVLNKRSCTGHSDNMRIWRMDSWERGIFPDIDEMGKH